jgi:hypothetical protein
MVALRRAAARQGQQHAVPDETAPASTTPASSGGYRVVMADDPQPWSEAENQGNLLSLSPQARLAGFERLTRDGAALIVICGRRLAGRTTREASLARGVLDVRIAVVPLPSGPLGQFAMSRIADQALGSGTHPPALVVSLLAQLAENLIDVGLVRSVIALDTPGIKLGHHMASYLPGSKLFAVQLTPTPYVTRVAGDRVGSAARFARPDYGPGGARLLVAGPRPVPAGLAEHWGVSVPSSPVRSPLQLPAFWHDENAGELVVVPEEPATWVAGRIPAAPARACRWCGEPLAEPVRSCVFCGHTPPPRPAPSSPPATS